MRVLWITNITFPEAYALMGVKTAFKGGGGWMLAAAESLIQQKGVELSILSVSDVKKMTYLEGERIKYYVIPRCKTNDRYSSFMRKVNQDVKPDIVHIHGTELSYGLAWLEACPSDNVVVSIQGLIRVISNYYLAGLTNREIISNITIRDLLRQTLYGERNSFIKRGMNELAVLKKVHHVIGRTSFDLAHCKAVNPSINYYHCDETLRSEFYQDSWKYEKCTPHTIFMSTAAYPIKGLHMVLRALSLIKNEYPNVQLRIAGDDIVHLKGVVENLRKSGYSKLLQKLLDKYKLQQSVCFTGRLDAEGMKREYLNANVFICPSAIENSPNSLGEAQILGVPVIASYVGGVPDMMQGDEDHLYRFEEFEMLSYKIKKIFEQKNNIDTFAMQLKARQRHDAVKNIHTLMEIYYSINE